MTAGAGELTLLYRLVAIIVGGVAVVGSVLVLTSPQRGPVVSEAVAWGGVAVAAFVAVRLWWIADQDVRGADARTDVGVSGRFIPLLKSVAVFGGAVAAVDLTVILNSPRPLPALDWVEAGVIVAAPATVWLIAGRKTRQN